VFVIEIVEDVKNSVQNFGKIYIYYVIDHGGA
jgi:hypothetical protein